MRAHIMRICISYDALSSSAAARTRFSLFFHPLFFFFFFSWVAICQIARDAQLCDVTCLFSSSSEKKAGINGFCRQE